MKRDYSRRDAFRAIAAGAPLVGASAQTAAAQPTADVELAAAERRLTASIEGLRRFPLAADSEPAVVFKA